MGEEIVWKLKERPLEEGCHWEGEKERRWERARARKEGKASAFLQFFDGEEIERAGMGSLEHSEKREWEEMDEGMRGQKEGSWRRRRREMKT